MTVPLVYFVILELQSKLNHLCLSLDRSLVAVQTPSLLPLAMIHCRLPTHASRHVPHGHGHGYSIILWCCIVLYVVLLSSFFVRHTSYVRYEIGREMPKPRRLSVFHPSPPVPMATNGQTKARYFIELVCLSSNLMEFASEFVFLSVVAPVRPFLTDRRTEYISLNLSVCRIT